MTSPMARFPVSRARPAALILSLVGAVLVAAPSRADAQSSDAAQPSAAAAAAAALSPGDAMMGYLRTLATEPKDFQALIGAGNAALDLGDAQAAAGFFGRADEVWPTSPLPKSGAGAAMVLQGDAADALVMFQRAVELKGSLLTFAADRGLAYDLLGRHSEAQADYRLALNGGDRDEARRRLALSLAITGNKAEALTTLGPLMAKGDAAAARCRALVLALSGDTLGAKRTLEAAMPGSSSQMDPFFRRLPALSSRDKAAAVNLGIFPDAQSTATYAAAARPPVPSGDRLASIAEMLGQTQQAITVAPPTAPPPVPSGAAVAIPQRVASAVAAATPRRSAPVSGEKRYWVQLASGSNAGAMPQEFRRIKSRKPDYFDGINPYVADSDGRARLLIGPFKDKRDAETFAVALESERINAFSWISPPGQAIRKISAE